MSPATWRRVSELFALALELPAHERAGLLERQDERTRREVERLLAEHQRSGLLDHPILPPGDLAEADLWTGKLLKERYRIERFLARGGAGAVYVARDEQIAGRPVIVKFLHTWARQYPWLQHKFREEMEALARIDHHGVVGILDAGEMPDGLPFLVIEYIDGITLRAEIQKGPMEIARVARLMREIGRAVSAAHDKGVLHRDLKPENIMLEHPSSESEAVRLIDFGIARVENGDAETLTHTTRFAGTTPYMAPEQLAGRPQAASDIYAMGVIAYEMLSGLRPFLAASPVELYEQQRAGVKHDLRAVRQEVPQAAVSTIGQQLSFRPENRTSTALEAGQQIAAALEGRLREPWSRRRVAGVLIGGMGSAGAGVYAWSRTVYRPLDPNERVIELAVGTEPLEHGFKKDLDIDYHVLPNADATAIDSMRVISHDQGTYSHPLTAAQARAALKGWQLTMEAAVEDGNIYCGMDNPSAPRRHAVCLVRNPDGPDSVNCVLLAAPVRQLIDRPLPGPPGVRRGVVMTWTPKADAEVWVDGLKLISGYQGAPDFRYSLGLNFGTARYRSQKGSGIFWKVRLEIG